METMQQPEISIIDGTEYKVYRTTFRGNTYNVMVAKGKFNYINVRKVTNNPFGTLGRDFESFDKAVLHYNSGHMKAFLLQIETGLI